MEPTFREALSEAGEAVTSLARDHVAVSIGLGVLVGEVVYRSLVRSHVRRAIGWEPS